MMQEDFSGFVRHEMDVVPISILVGSKSSLSKQFFQVMI